MLPLFKYWRTKMVIRFRATIIKPNSILSDVIFYVYLHVYDKVKISWKMNEIYLCLNHLTYESFKTKSKILCLESNWFPTYWWYLSLLSANKHWMILMYKISSMHSQIHISSLVCCEEWCYKWYQQLECEKSFPHKWWISWRTSTESEQTTNSGSQRYVYCQMLK